MEIASNWVFVLAKADPTSNLLRMEHHMIHGFARTTEHPIHKNLNTSFVNLSALVRHLRGLQFMGTVQIELSSYEAEIEFTENGSIMAREQDHIAGRLCFGEDALQRIMIRSKQPGGVINVYKGADAAGQKTVFVDEAIVAGAKKMAAGAVRQREINRMEDLFIQPAALAPIPRPSAAFDADNVENWTELVALMSELMQTVDEALAKANINFGELFRNACGFASFDHPFLDPDTDIFSYDKGYISLRQKLGSRDLINGVTAALSRIMERLREDPYFGNVCHLTMHRLRVLANRRKLQFEMFGLGREMQKITGI